MITTSTLSGIVITDDTDRLQVTTSKDVPAQNKYTEYSGKNKMKMIISDKICLHLTNHKRENKTTGCQQVGEHSTKQRLRICLKKKMLDAHVLSTIT